MYLEPECQQVDRMFAELSERMDTRTLKLGTSKLLEKVLRTAFKGSIPRTVASTKNTEGEHILRNHIILHNKTRCDQEMGKFKKAECPISTRLPSSTVVRTTDLQPTRSPYGNQQKFYQVKLQPSSQQLELGRKSSWRYLKYAQRKQHRSSTQCPE